MNYKTTIRLCVVIILLLPFIYIYFNPLTMNCFCDEPAWWKVCVPGTEKGSQSCDKMMRGIEKITVVYNDVTSGMSKISSKLKIKIPEIDVSKIPSLHSIIDSGFNVPELPTKSLRFTIPELSCAFPNPITMMQKEGSKMIDKVTKPFTIIITDIKNKMSTITVFFDDIAKLGNIIPEKINQFCTIITGTITSIVDKITNVISVIVTSFEVIKIEASKIIQKLLNGITFMSDSIMIIINPITDQINTIKGFFTNFSFNIPINFDPTKIIGQMIEFAKKTIQDIQNGINNAIADVDQSFKALGGALESGIANAAAELAKIQQVGVLAKQALENGIKAAQQAIANLTNQIAQISGQIDAAANKLIDLGKVGISAATTAVNLVKDNAIKYANQGIKEINNQINKLEGDITNALGNVIGLKNQFANEAQDIARKAEEEANKVKDAIENQIKDIDNKIKDVEDKLIKVTEQINKDLQNFGNDLKNVGNNVIKILKL